LSHRKDTDYLSISTRVRAMENQLLARERMDRMIEARDDAEARKVMSECGYSDSLGLEQALMQARAEVFADLAKAVPDPGLVEVFQLKYDYHNAKVLLKAQAMDVDPQRLLLPGGRYDGQGLAEDWKRGDLRSCTGMFREAMQAAWTSLQEERDPQKADLILDRACYSEMAHIAKAQDSAFLQGYARLMVDVANLRAAVRIHRMGKGNDFLRQVLLPGGNVSQQAIAAARGEALGEVFHHGLLAEAGQLGAAVTRPGSGALTEFERSCDDAVTAYLAQAHRISFGEEPIIGYLYAKEQELTAIRTIFAGRAAGLDGDTIRRRLRATYA